MFGRSRSFRVQEWVLKERRPSQGFWTGEGDLGSPDERFHFDESLGSQNSKAGYLKAIWPEFFGGIFEVWPAPGAR